MLVFEPFLHIRCNIGLVSVIKRALSVCPTLLLPLPSEISVEIELLEPSESEVFAHIDDVTEVDCGVSLHGVDQRIGIAVVLGDFASTQIAFPALASLLFLFHLAFTTDENVDNNLGLIVHYAIHAPINGTFDINIVDGAAVHENAFALPDVRREDARDGSRGHSCVGHLRERDVLLRELSVRSCFDVGCRYDEALLDVGEVARDTLQEGEKWSVIN